MNFLLISNHYLSDLNVHVIIPAGVLQLLVG
jgi:hypothetical protein